MLLLMLMSNTLLFLNNVYYSLAGGEQIDTLKLFTHRDTIAGSINKRMLR